MPSAALDVLYEDNHLLAVNKPAGPATMGAASGVTSLVDMAKEYLRTRYAKPGNVYVGVVSRLDAAVSGVLLLARTSRAAARLAEQFRTRGVQKTYWALVAGSVEPPAGELIDWLYKDETQRRMAVTRPGAPGALEAVLRYRKIGEVGADSLLEIELITGRKHQIRLQWAACGHPVRGDRKYGSRQPFAAGIALHARRLTVDHPTRHEPLEIVAPLPPSWSRLGIAG